MKKTIKSFVNILSGNISLALSTFLIASIIVSNYGMSDYGEYVVAQTLFMVLPIISRPLIWQAIVRYKKDIPLKELFYTSIIVEYAIGSFTFAIILSVMWGLNAAFTFDYKVFENGYFVAISFLSLLYNIGSAIGFLRATERYFVISLIMGMSSLLKVVFCYFSTLDISDLSLCLLAFDAATGLVTILICIYLCQRMHGEVNIKYKNIDKITRFSLWGSLQSFLDLPISQLDRVVVSIFLDSALLGVFNLIKRLGGMLTQLSEPVTQILLNKFVRSDLQMADIKSIERLAFLFVTFLLPFSIISFIITFPTLNEFMFNGELRGYSNHLLMYFLVQAISMIFIWVHPACLALSLMKKITVIVGVGNFIYITLLVLSINFFGIYGLIISSAIQICVVICLKRKFVIDELRVK